jgi:hypothetical protein
MGNMQITNAPTRSQADTLFMVVEHLAERPAPSTPGRVCFIRDSGVYFIDSGEFWTAQLPFPPYPTVADLEANASFNDNFVFCAEVDRIYGISPIGTLTVDHMTVLSMAGETEYVWKAAISALGFVAMGGAEASRPLAANMMFGLYFNTTTGILQWSDGATWHNASS